MDRNAVTYEYCGIPDVEAFYATKQQGQSRPDPDALRRDPEYASAIWWAKHLWVGRVIAAIAELRGRPVRILEYGCGYGSLGFLASLVPCELYGVDYNIEAAPALRAAGYVDFVAGDFQSVDLSAHAPFDVICSLDVYGHVEFRRKDALLERWKELLTPDGAVVEGVETGDFDYFSGPQARRRFAEVDGHVGIEPWPDILARYAKVFSHVGGQHHFGITLDHGEIVKQRREYGATSLDTWARICGSFDPDEAKVFDVVQGLLFWELAAAWDPRLDAVGGFGFLVASDDPDVAALRPATFPGLEPLDAPRWVAELAPRWRAVAEVSAAFSAWRAGTADLDVPQIDALPVRAASPARVRALARLRSTAATVPLAGGRDLLRWAWRKLPQPVRASAPVAAARRAVSRLRAAR